MNPNALIVTLTAGQLAELISNAVTDTIDKKLEERMPRAMESGIDGLARVIGCSRTYAQQLKNDGVFTNSITQRGRIISVDVIEAQKEWSNYQNREL